LYYARDGSSEYDGVPLHASSQRPTSPTSFKALKGLNKAPLLDMAPLLSTAFECHVHARSLGPAASMDSGASRGDDSTRLDSTRLDALRLYANAAPLCEARVALSDDALSDDAAVYTKASALLHATPPLRRPGESRAARVFSDAESAFRNSAAAKNGAANVGQLPP
jgi:hypothetical protein